MKRIFPTLAGLTPYDNAADGGSPRGCFQIFAERKYGGDGIGAQMYQGSFHSLEEAQRYTEELVKNDDFYTGFYDTAQVGDMFHGGIWALTDGEWEQVEEADGDE